ncbi:trehalase family glycosidase [Zhouia sp. PK063]|uniref:trehalase family glycosidase n=1 Tax=Zhouia sp. PK063 TaxID=3373602 RepID=UPI0037BC6757
MKNRKINPLLYLMIVLTMVAGCTKDKKQQDNNVTFNLDVNETINRLLAAADKDGDKKITKDDNFSDTFEIIDTNGETVSLQKTYFLSNLLQELALARNEGKVETQITLQRIEEAPSHRISRMIKDYFWDDLTRTIDEQGLDKILSDDKANDNIQRIYVPHDDKEGIAYFEDLQHKYKQLQVVVLPEHITPEYVRSINDKPGILSLKLQNGKGVPFVVPGGRFNEMYGWDSYFIGVGLLLDGRTQLAKDMVDNFCYQINHYGKILNANRSYYLTRTQPPFLSSYIRMVYEAMSEKNEKWLSYTLETAIKEYQTVWMEKGKRLTNDGLNRYFAAGIGIPPETEKGHFDEILSEYAKKHHMSLNEFKEAYTSRKIQDANLDLYFVHDRSLRESGHDTSWRLDDVCAYLNTVDLNSLLYKYETDFSYMIKTYFNGNFTTSSGKDYTSAYWDKQAEHRKELMNKLLWNENDGTFYDYNFVDKKQTMYQSATNYYPLWAKLATKEQAATMVKDLMSRLKAKGGILSTSEKSVAAHKTNNVQRQWDYPNGWAPHQMLLWEGLRNYGYDKEAQELAYRWLWTITKNAVDYNGTIPEKYDVVNATHKVYAEYGNVGTDFAYITTSGFGWMNSSYQLGLKVLSEKDKNELDKLDDPDALFESKK